MEPTLDRLLRTVDDKFLRAYLYVAALLSMIGPLVVVGDVGGDVIVTDLELSDVAVFGSFPDAVAVIGLLTIGVLAAVLMEVAPGCSWCTSVSLLLI